MTLTTIYSNIPHSPSVSSAVSWTGEKTGKGTQHEDSPTCHSRCSGDEVVVVIVATRCRSRCNTSHIIVCGCGSWQGSWCQARECVGAGEKPTNTTTKRKKIKKKNLNKNTMVITARRRWWCRVDGDVGQCRYSKTATSLISVKR